MYGQDILIVSNGLSINIGILTLQICQKHFATIFQSRQMKTFAEWAEKVSKAALLNTHF